MIFNSCLSYPRFCFKKLSNVDHLTNMSRKIFCWFSIVALVTQVFGLNILSNVGHHINMSRKIFCWFAIVALVTQVYAFKKLSNAGHLTNRSRAIFYWFALVVLVTPVFPRINSETLVTLQVSVVKSFVDFQ